MDYNEIYLPIDTVKSKYIDDKKITKLKKLDIDRVYDMIYYFPRAYDDRTSVLHIGDLKGEEYAVIRARIMSVFAPPTRSGLKMVKANVSDGTGVLEIVWFQMPYLRKSLKIGEEYVFIGQIKRGYVFQIVNPEFKLASSPREMGEGDILPIYSSIKDIPQKIFRRMMDEVLSKYIDVLEENIPQEIIQKYNIMSRKKAIKEIHFPTTSKNLEEAKRRFAIEELLVLEMGILQKRFQIDNLNSKKYTLANKKELVTKYLSTLKFSLTNAQKKVITDIYNDLNAGKIVNRLLQGDVGSGKTVVSMVLLLYMVANSYQGALMAPTEILANQHYLSIKDTFASIGIRVELLTGSFKGKAKEHIISDIASGDVNVVIGTHALIEENVVFKNLGLIIIDEQHRFGVVQRKKLRDKGVLANLIVMSATPIPRSLALSIYGDLDVSIIDELPPGRLPIKTKWIATDIDLRLMYSFISKKLKQGRQAYFIAPLIEESEKLSVKSVQELYEEVHKNLPQHSIGMLHGKMKSDEKNGVMEKFKNGMIEILISTTVIEVGVDVPNATMMIISNAERFGLSALHQLRGRVGRGKEQSYCFLISRTDNAISKSRLNIMESTNDGFKIAEEDLRLRKPGEIFGVKQSGLSDLKFIDIIHDVKTIELVKTNCTDYLHSHNGKIENIYLSIDIEEKFNRS